jgi:hypothetical protein
MGTWVDKVRLQFEDGGSAQYVAAGKKVAGSQNEMAVAAKTLNTVFKALAGAWATQQIFQFAAASVAAAAEAGQASARLAGVLRATGKASEISAAQVGDLAAGFAEFTTFESNAIVGAQAMLLQFDNIGAKSLPRATQAVLDLAASTGDLNGSAMMLGKALQGEEGALSALGRSGIKFNDEAQKTIERLRAIGRGAEADDMILSKLEGRVGGLARAAGESESGEFLNLQKRFGEMQEDVGMLLLPVITDLGSALMSAAEAALGLDVALTSDDVKAYQQITKDAGNEVGNLKTRIDEMTAAGGAVGLEKIRADFDKLAAGIKLTATEANSGKDALTLLIEEQKKNFESAQLKGSPLKPLADEKGAKAAADKKIAAEEAALQALNQIRDDNLQASHEGRLQIIENQYATERAMAAEFGFDLQEIADKRDRLVLDEETKNAEAQIALAEKTFDEKKALADKEKEIATARAGYVLDVAQSYGEALKMVVGSNKKGAAALKAIGIFEAGVNGARAVLQAMTLPPPVAAFAVPAAILAAGVQTAKIATAKFAAGGFPSGRGAMIQVNEREQESVLNGRATSRLGVAGVTALNSGAPYPGRTTNEISYSPVYNFAGGAAPDILAALENDKNRFASFLTRLQKRGYLATAGAL